MTSPPLRILPAELAAAYGGADGDVGLARVRPSSAKPCILALACVVLAGCGWYQAGYDPGRSGDNTTETHLGATNVAGIGEAWHADGIKFSTQPIVTGGLVLAWTDHCALPNCVYGIQALAPDSGAVRWTLPPDDLAVDWSLASDGTRFFVLRRLPGSFSSWVIDARSVADGSLLWTSDSVGQPKGALTVADGEVFAVGKLAAYAFDATTGKNLWAVITTQVAWQAVTVNGDTAFVGDGSNLIAVDAHSGHQRWITSDDFQFFYAMTKGSRVYASLRDDSTANAYDVATGRRLWQTTTPRTADPWMPLADTTGLYAPSDGNGTVTARDPATGALRWTWDQAGNLSISRVRQPAEANGVLYVAADTTRGPELFAVDAATGKTLHTITYTGSFIGSPVIWNGTVFIVVDETLHAYR
jgi:outer membrane protein assembly factor BamB